jgi:hypothetical protein
MDSRGRTAAVFAWRPLEDPGGRPATGGQRAQANKARDGAALLACALCPPVAPRSGAKTALSVFVFFVRFVVNSIDRRD